MFMEITKQLWKIHEDLEWEAGMSTLTISAGGMLSLFPLVEEVVKRAPQVEGWKIVAFKQPHNNVVIQMGSDEFSANELKVELVPIGAQFGAIVYFKDYAPGGPHGEIAMLLLDATLGEKRSATNIIDLDCRPYTPDCDSLPTILELRRHFGVQEPAD